MPPRLPPGDRPRYVAGTTVYVSLETYDPASRKKKHRGSIALKRWSVTEVREIIIEAFTARQVRQKGDDQDPPPQWADSQGAHDATHTKS